jgi:hypothetical protein
VPPETARPESAGGANRPGLGDFRGQRKSRSPLIQNPDRAQAQRRLRRQRLVEQVHRFGARVIFELLDEIDRHHGLGDDLDRRLARYAGLDADILRALAADRFPPVPPPRLVEDGQ